MKKEYLNNMGLQEMSVDEMKELNGGSTIWTRVFGAAIAFGSGFLIAATGGLAACVLGVVVGAAGLVTSVSVD